MKSGVGLRVGFTFSWLDWIVEFPGGLKKERPPGRIGVTRSYTDLFKPGSFYL